MARENDGFVRGFLVVKVDASYKYCIEAIEPNKD